MFVRIIVWDDNQQSLRVTHEVDDVVGEAAFRAAAHAAWRKVVDDAERRIAKLDEQQLEVINRSAELTAEIGE